jgi:serine/threonine protein kinase
VCVPVVGQAGQPRTLTARIGDFGISKFYACQPGEVRTAAPFGTPGYIAPEVMEGLIAPSGAQSGKSDVYAFGIFVIQVGLSTRCGGEGGYVVVYACVGGGVWCVGSMCNMEWGCRA